MRLVLVVAATAAGACGRLSFDYLPDAAPVARTCDWSSGPPFSGPAIQRTDLSSTGDELDPFLAPGDPLTMRFGSTRDGDADVFVAHRPAIDQPFDQIAKQTDLSMVGADETGLILDATGTNGFYSKGLNIHAVVRDVPGGPLRDAGAVTELAIDPVYIDAWPSPDRLGMTFSGGVPVATIYTANRARPSDPWSNIVASPVNLPGVSAAGATLTADQLVMVWSSDAGGDVGIFYAVRETVDQPFTTGLPLTATASPSTDFEPSIREDGCELFFGRLVGNNNDIFSLVAEP